MPDVLTEVRKRRGPATRIMIALVIAWMVLGIVRTVLAVLEGQAVLEAVRRHAGDLVSVPVVLVLLLFVVADVWVRPRLANAATLARGATWVASLAVAVQIGGRVAGLWDPLLRGTERALGVADILISSVVPVLLCVALATVAKAAQRAEVQAGPAAPAEVDGPVDADGPAPGGTEFESPAASGAEENAPTWAPDAAAGAAWTTAADAARGGGAAAWGDDRNAFGWQPPEDAGEDDDPRGNRPDSSPRTTAGQLDRGLWEGPPREGE